MEKIINSINKIDDNLFIIKLRNNIGIDKFIKTYIYFEEAVNNWSIILSKLIVKVPTYKERYPVINNLYDEHGNGNLNENHVSTFKRLMEKLIDVNNDKSYEKYLVESSKNEIDSFNSTLESIIDNRNWLYSFAVLGMIEYVYITISKEIHCYVKNFINSDVDHYSIHEIVDDKHSKDFFDVLNDHYLENKLLINEGLQKGYDIFNKLYYELALNMDK